MPPARALVTLFDPILPDFVGRDAQELSLTLLRAGALGDTVLTLPAVQVLRTRYPLARIRVIGYPRWWELAGLLIDEVASIDATLFATLYAGRPAERLTAWLRETDAFVSWSARSVATAAAAARVPLLESTPYPPPGEHAATWLIKTIAPSPHTPIMPVLSFTSVEVRAARAVLRALGADRPIFLHPGAGALWKRWPPERFARLGDALTGRGHIVVLIAGPADEEAISETLQAAAIAFPVVRERSIRGLAALLSEGTIFVGNDSGVTHLAAAAGTPTVALFGPTDPESWRPLGKVSVVQACTSRPSRQGQIRVCDDPACLEQLPVDEVLRAIDALAALP
jgi:heptosyltransferase III